MSSADSADPECVSMQSDASMFEPVGFKAGTKRQLSAQVSICSVCGQPGLDPVPLPCGHSPWKQCVTSEGDDWDFPSGDCCPECGKKRKRAAEQQTDTDKDRRLSQLQNVIKEHKKQMQNKFQMTSEGNGDEPSPLNNIYTPLYITKGKSEGPSEEHEFRHLEHKWKRQKSEELIVRVGNLFVPFPKKPHRTVLTNGVAGIGKSFAVHKFILDWAEEKENTDIDFVFILPFRELNLIKNQRSFLQLLREFHPALGDLQEDLENTKVIVILDGLDESRSQLDFENMEIVRSVTQVTSVGNLITNLIKGYLLRLSLLWITSRPASAYQIPSDCVDTVTEIRGFNDSQKEAYFRKRFSNQSDQVDAIISHIRSSQMLDIMCQIPIFCWICAVLFEEIFIEGGKAEVPQTMTEMMAQFVLVQTKRSSSRYKKNPEKLLKTHREFLLKLGKLAFIHLQNNNLIFYEEDLKECGIDTQEATVYSGFWNSVLRNEDIFSQRKVFYFVHLTIQEFFAALYIYDCLTSSNTKDLSSFLDLKQTEHSLLELLKMTIDKALRKKNGHLAYFLRFLLGLMVEFNRRSLQGLLISPDPSPDTIKKILMYLKTIRSKDFSPDSCIHLFQTLVEMGDNKTKEMIQEYLESKDRPSTELTPLHCSALAFMVQVSKNDMDVLDLKSYNTTDEGRRRLIPAVRSTRKAMLDDCKVTAEWLNHLACVLKSPYSLLRELDLSNNDLEDSGVQLLCNGLSSQSCRLKILRLSGCLVTEEGCDSLVSALQSNPHHMSELDLSYNDPGDSGKDKLKKLVDDSHYKLVRLNCDYGGKHRMKPRLKKYACELTFDPRTAHKDLCVSKDQRKVTCMEKDQRQEQSDHWPQVLCKQGLNERWYWEMEVMEPFNVGLMYRGSEWKLGQSEKSWSLVCSSDGCFACHSNERVSVSSVCSRSSRVAVYLDWPGGTLSFYRVFSDTRVLLHTFREAFTEHLYPAVELQANASALFC
ncbi:NLR family CARD domain-containing protein 3-like isoform X3 [Sphaeramia orbicularis]|uniref:NLR family CARD domain-containing protein 3-like n=2 Tax=Sphaeramia orbicularis TaxID=375764 RepID=A0A673AD75_9TELE|nr:NLR family CARD domain-containing protein 3-like isoform X3 [Sphaeramia orbicularis]XP_030017389.1 NLR family CARD domain-containing protein 3-like isoform X3 [Sphaeramia orbicularis]